MSVTATSVLAVVAAALGAICFGLAAVRQHSAVRATLSEVEARGPATDASASATSSRSRVVTGLSRRLAPVVRVVQRPAWLLGAGQAGLGGLLHVAALTLAPVTLVQPIGVLAVPVTVVASARLRRRWPHRAQVVGSSLSLVGVVALTVVLLAPTTHRPVLPAWGALACTVATVVAVAAAAGAALRRAPALTRCVGRAVVAASLFGTGSVLVRILGRVLTTAPTQHVPLLGSAVAGLALVMPLGVWSMQSAYAAGTPQVVICCLTLVDPVAAVAGGRLLLADGSAVTGSTLLAALACALVAALGVVLLARDYPVDGSSRGDESIETRRS